jgi:hypothetical protein
MDMGAVLSVTRININLKRRLKMRKLILTLVALFVFPSLSFPDVLDHVPAYDQGRSWYCTYVSEASVFGYWDQQGYDNLFDAAAPELYDTTAVWSEIEEMRSYHTMYLEDGIEDFADSKGYNFTATIYAPDRPQLYEPYNFNTIVNEIDEGRPVILTSRFFDQLPDTTGHATPVFGYDIRDEGNFIAYYMNWSEDEDILWRLFPEITYKDFLVTIEPFELLNFDISGGPGPITVSAVSNANPVPEPGTMLLLGTGLIGLAGWGRKKFKK